MSIHQHLNLICRRRINRFGPLLWYVKSHGSYTLWFILYPKSFPLQFIAFCYNKPTFPPESNLFVVFWDIFWIFGIPSQLLHVRTEDVHKMKHEMENPPTDRDPSDDEQTPNRAGINRSFHEFLRMVNYSTRGWNTINCAISCVTERVFVLWPRILRFICLLQEKSLSVLTLACCFLLVWSTKKTAGSCILDTGGLDNELPVWCCQKSFGSLVKHGACNINNSNPGFFTKI